MELGSQTIGCIGVGNMGGAIATGLARTIDPARIICYDSDPSRLSETVKRLGVTAGTGAADAAARSSVLILAVKPNILPPLLGEIRGSLKGLLISVAAGVSLKRMESAAGKVPIIRVMPNTPSLIGEGISALSPNAEATPEMTGLALEIFSALGRTVIIEEKLMDAVTAISGCGPAYAYTMIQAMADGGVKMGLPRDTALLLAAQTLLGAARMVLLSGEDPMALRGRVASPGGSTIDAIHVMERAGFSGIVMDAIEKAAGKSRLLGGDQ